MSPPHRSESFQETNVQLRDDSGGETTSTLDERRFVSRTGCRRGKNHRMLLSCGIKGG